MFYRLVSIDYYDRIPNGELGNAIITVEERPTAGYAGVNRQYARVVEGLYAVWRNFNTGKALTTKDDIADFLNYSVDKLFKAQLVLLGKKDEPNTKELPEPTRFDKIQTES